METNQIDKESFSFKPNKFVEVDTDPDNDARCVRKPEPRSGHRTVCDDANLYCFGGYQKTDSGSQQHKLFEELWCFNFAESRWKYLPTTGTAPKELASHCTILYGNFLHVFGGTGVEFGETSSNKLNKCDLRRLKWEEVLTAGEPPPPMYGQAVVFDDKTRRMYVVGGTTGFEFSMDVHRIDLTSKTWELMYACKGDQSEPSPRYRHEVAFDGKSIYVFGGGTSITAFSLKIVPTFCLQTRKWSILKTRRNRFGSIVSPDGKHEIPGFPSRRKCHASVQMGDDVYICGGSNNTTVYSDVWRFHIPTKQWHFLPIRIPIPLSFHTASLTSSGCVYIFGGVTDIEKGVRTNRVFKIWFKIPSLQEIAWEALLACNKEIKTSTHSALTLMGIPRDYVRRVHPSPPGGQPDVTVESVWKSDYLSLNNSTCLAPTPQSCLNSFV